MDAPNKGLGFCGRVKTMRAMFILGATLLLSACQSGSLPQLLAVAAQEDRRELAPDAWDELLVRAESAEVRLAAARAVGRLREPQLLPLLRRALPVEREESVRCEIAFAFGQIGSAEVLPEVLRLAREDSVLVRAVAAEALGKLGEPSATSDLLALCKDPHSEVRKQALLALARLVGRRAVPPATVTEEQQAQLLSGLSTALHDVDPEVCWRAAYALSEVEVPGRIPRLRELLTSEIGWARLFAARGLGRIGVDGGASADDLVGLLEDPDAHVAAAAAEAVGLLGGSSHVLPLAQSSMRAQGPADHHVRAATLQALVDLHARLASREEASEGESFRRVIAALMERSLQDPSQSVRRAALRGLARLDAGRAQPVVTQWAQSDVHWNRQFAAEAAASLGTTAALPLLDRLAKDPSPAVSVAALESLGQREEWRAYARPAALAALKRADLAVRATALTLLKDVGTNEDWPLVRDTLQRARSLDEAELRVGALEVAVAIGGADALPLLQEALSDVSLAVRDVARREYRKLAIAAPVPAHVAEALPSTGLEEADLLRNPARRPRVALHTDRGRVVVELLPAVAPRHVKSFLRLAQGGVYDGLSFHRVVTGFVVQGLDPRGDGWGTAGVFLRDEISAVPYLRGSVGMPNAGRDSGGCQLFITHLPTPHLDGRYTVFGQVIEGMDVVDALDLGDRCQRVEILES